MSQYSDKAGLKSGQEVNPWVRTGHIVTRQGQHQIWKPVCRLIFGIRTARVETGMAEVIPEPRTPAMELRKKLCGQGSWSHGVGGGPR